MSLDMVFFSDTSMETGKSERELNVLFGLNAQQQESWLKSQLPDFEEVGSVKTIAELRKVIKSDVSIQLAILMRKNPHGGVDKPEEIARVILEHHPDAQIFIIVGTQDQRGNEIISAAESLGCRTLVANGQPISGKDILNVVQELADKVRGKEASLEDQEESKSTLKMILVEGAKGGSGVTTALAALSRYLSETTHERVSLLDFSKGTRYLLQDQEGIHILDPDGDQDFPNTGWLLLEHPGEPPSFLDELKHQLYHVLMVDPSREAMDQARKKMKDDTLVVINRAVIEIMPEEIFEGELKRKPTLMIENNPTAYMLTTWDDMLKDWQPLFEYIVVD